MKRASNIIELANNLYPTKSIDKTNAEFYVPLYEDIVNELRDEIIYGKSDVATFTE